MGIDASEISEILKSEIEGLTNEGEISEVGTVLTAVSYTHLRAHET